MTLSITNHLFSQFAFSPVVGGMTLPSVQGAGARPYSPENPADFLDFAALNRSLRSESLYGPRSEYVQVANSVKTTLGDPQRPDRYVESLFDYLGEDGFIDRSVDLREDRDLAHSRFIAQTIVSRSSVTKSMSCGRLEGNPEAGFLKDGWLGLKVSGERLETVAVHDPDFIGLPPGYGLVELAVAFSAFVYFTDSLEPAIAADGLYVVDAQGNRRRALHQGIRDFREAWDIVEQATDGRRIEIVSRDSEEGKSYLPYLKMSFSRSEREGFEAEVRIASAPFQNMIVLRNGLLGIAEFLLGSR